MDIILVFMLGLIWVVLGSINYKLGKIRDAPNTILKRECIESELAELIEFESDGHDAQIHQ